MYQDDHPNPGCSSATPDIGLPALVPELSVFPPCLVVVVVVVVEGRPVRFLGVMQTLEMELSGGSKRYVTAHALSVWPRQLGW